MGTHPIFESDFDCLTEKKMGLLRGRRIFQIRWNTNYYTYLGVRYNAPVEEISNAINFRKSEILEKIKIAEDEIELKRALGMLKRIQKVLLNEELRKNYNFHERETLADTIPEIQSDHGEIKQLTASHDVFTEELPKEDSKAVRHAADYALLEELNEERQIYVYNNAKEVVTHTNYTYEELAAMSAMASLDDAETEESKSERKRNALWLIPGSIIFYYYW